MRALIYKGPGEKALEDRPIPQIKSPTDAIVRISRTTICGTDLHILKGDVPTCAPGRSLGHEGVGIVEEVGAAVTAFRRGDYVLISCISACGKCEYCRKGMHSHCTSGGWILGNQIDGTQAEYVHVSHADTSLYPIPDGADEEALVMLSVQAQKIDPTLLITHRFKLDQILDAYETFGQAARTRALKVIIEA
jgi:alcohol dehydrogenase